MSGEALWALDERNIACRLPPDEAVWIPTVNYAGSQCPFRRLASTAYSVWSLAADGRPYLWLNGSDTHIRASEETWQNERWYPVIGWSGKTLVTERREWSDDGGEYKPREAIFLPSGGWRWMDPWTPDTNLHNGDKQGWQYAFNFTSPQWRRHSYGTAMVRRRRWHRTRVYIGVDRWVQLKRPHGCHLVDICVNSVTAKSRGGLTTCIWALDRSGRIWLREGVTDDTPEGEQWTLLEAVIMCKESDDNEINQIACAPTAHPTHLWAITWDGRLAHYTAESNAWIMKTTPQNLPLISVAPGVCVLWACTIDGRLWATRFTAPSTTASWVHMSDDMCRVAVGRGDSAFGISQTDEQIYVRSHVTDEEPFGREWKKMTCSKLEVTMPRYVPPPVTRANRTDSMSDTPSTEVSNEQAERIMTSSDNVRDSLPLYDEENAVVHDDGRCLLFSFGKLPELPSTSGDHRWLQVAPGGCETLNSTRLPTQWLNGADKAIVSEIAFLTIDDKESTWRYGVLDGMRTQNSLVTAVFGDFAQPFAPTSAEDTDNAQSLTSEQIECQVKSSGQDKFAEGKLTIHNDRFIVSYRRGQTSDMVFSLDKCTAVVSDVQHSTGRRVLRVYTEGLARMGRPLKLSFTRYTDGDSLYSAINASIKAELRMVTVDFAGYCKVIVARCTYSRRVYVTVSKCSLVDTAAGDACSVRWMPLDSHVTTVDVAANGVLYTLSHAQHVYASQLTIRQWIMCPTIDLPTTSSQSDMIVDDVWQNERHSTFWGWTTFERPMNGVWHSWSAEDTTIPRKMAERRLPSPSWTWTEEWTVDRLPDSDVNGWVYGRRSFDEQFTSFSSFVSRKPCVRRRRHRRMRRAEIAGPWVELKAHVQTRFVDIATSPYCDSVWAVTTSGVVLCAKTKSTSKNVSWAQVYSSISIARLHAVDALTVWAIGTDGQPYIRNAVTFDTLIVVDWMAILDDSEVRSASSAQSRSIYEEITSTRVTPQNTHARVFALRRTFDKPSGLFTKASPLGILEIVERGGVSDKCAEGNAWRIVSELESRLHDCLLAWREKLCGDYTLPFDSIREFYM